MTSLICQSEHLVIRRFDLRDNAFVFDLLNTDGWIKYIGNRNILTLEDAENYIRSKFLKTDTEFGFGYFVVELKASKTPIGTVGILKRDYLDLPDLGFAFLPEYCGQGFAFEASLALKKYFKETYSLNDLCGITMSENSSSIELLKRLGFSYKKNIVDPSGESLDYYSSN